MALAAAILSKEVALRWTLGLGKPALFQADAEIGYMMAPNQEVYRLGNRIAINRFHQRAEDLPERPPEGVRRIFFIGDSITFGVSAVDQSEIYSEVVGQLLGREEPPVDVLNASAVSWGIANQRAYVERFGTFGSDIAVIQIGSADLIQPKSNGDGVGVRPQQPAQRPLSAIGELLGRYLVPRFMNRLGLVSWSSDEPVSRRDRNAQFRKSIWHFINLVAKIRAEGTEPVVLLVPGKPELIPPAERPFVRYQDFRRRFVKATRAYGIRLIDLASEWQGKAEVEGYYTDGTHLTREGNRVVAERIAEEARRIWSIGAQPPVSSDTPAPSVSRTAVSGPWSAPRSFTHGLSLAGEPPAERLRRKDALPE